jgi:hypothetical protein
VIAERSSAHWHTVGFCPFVCRFLDTVLTPPTAKSPQCTRCRGREFRAYKIPHGSNTALAIDCIQECGAVVDYTSMREHWENHCEFTKCGDCETRIPFVTDMEVGRTAFALSALY